MSEFILFEWLLYLLASLGLIFGNDIFHQLYIKLYNDGVQSAKKERKHLKISYMLIAVLGIAPACNTIYSGIQWYCSLWPSQGATSSPLDGTTANTGPAPATSAGTASAAAPPAANTGSENASYQQGHADAVRILAYVAQLQGAEWRGYQYWAANRSLPDRASCEDEAASLFPNDTSDAGLFNQGCQEGQENLDPVDVRRNSDPDYRQGWNDAIAASQSGN